jgi:hypothetical protein
VYSPGEICPTKPNLLPAHEIEPGAQGMMERDKLQHECVLFLKLQIRKCVYPLLEFIST